MHTRTGIEKPLPQPVEGVLDIIVIPSSRNNGLLLIQSFRKDEFTPSPTVGQWLSTSDVRDVVSRVLQTFQLIFGPSVVKFAIYIWVQLDGRIEM